MTNQELRDRWRKYRHLPGLQFGVAMALYDAELGYRDLTGERSLTIALLAKYPPIEVLRRQMHDRHQSRFGKRVLFLRHLIEFGALSTSCEAIVLDERFASIMPEDLKALAKANLEAARAA